MELLMDPSIWVGLLTLVVLEIVLGIDNLVFIAILADKLPPKQRDKARLIGLSLALIMRLALLSIISWLVTLTKPLFTVWDFTFSGRDLIMLLGGIFLLFKATTELHERLENREHDTGHGKGYASFWVVVTQIVILDAVFSLDAVITAVGMVNHLPVMMAAVGMAMACWIAVLAVAEAVQRVSRGTKTSLSYWGMVAAHLGLAVTITGIAFSQNYSVERDVRMRAGDSVTIHDYRFTFREVRDITGPNYRGGVALIGVTRHGEPEAVLHAEKRLYNTSRMVMTEAAIDGGLTRDLYAALGEELDNGAWAVRLYYKPFVRWIWAGGLLMALGGLLCLADPRYRRRKPLPEAG
ncbi:hypothetical protein AGQ53_07940 [Salmonella enterica subsp. enterica]|nr:hypothetical protein AGQ53_07940 [Salmonella enterica subsp. enterica]